MMIQNILRRDQVEQATGLPRSTLYAMISRGEFPRPVRLGLRSVGWFEQDVADWQKSRVPAIERTVVTNASALKS